MDADAPPLIMMKEPDKRPRASPPRGEPPCRICSSGTHRIRDQAFGIDYHHCPSCDFIFMDERALPSTEEERQEYLKHDNTRENTGYVGMLAGFIRSCIVPHQASVRTVLDFGCGPGPVLVELLTEAGFEVDAYDPHFFPEKVYEGRQYDLITATETLEHIHDPMESLRLLKKHLNPEGKLAVMTRFHPGDPEAFKTWWYRREASHVSFFSPTTISHMAGVLNMKVLMMDAERYFVLENA